MPRPNGNPSLSRAAMATPSAVLRSARTEPLWYHAGLPVLPIRWVLLRDPAGDFEPQALLCTDPTCDPGDIIGWFVQRWSLEVTFRETRDHLGVESQRQWSDQVIARTTSCLLALFPIVTLLGPRLGKRALGRLSRSMVPQAASHLRRHTGCRGMRNLESTGFFDVPFQDRQQKTAGCAVRRRYLRALSYRMSVAKWSKSN